MFFVTLEPRCLKTGCYECLAFFVSLQKNQIIQTNYNNYEKKNDFCCYGDSRSRFVHDSIV